MLSALATFGFDGRREALFSKEFVNAMKMLERDHIQRNRMLGSWAGNGTNPIYAKRILKLCRRWQ